MARDWIKELRIKRFSNQSALADAAGIKVSRLSRIEKGYCDLRPDEAEALARALGTSVAVIDGKGNGPASEPVEPPIVKQIVAVEVPRASTPIMESHTVTLPSVPQPKGLAAAKADAPVVEKPEPISDDLSNPSTFTLMPPTDALERTSSDESSFRTQLQRHIAFATRVLHTSKIRPVVWRAWRDFEKTAQDRLRVKEAPIFAESPPNQPVVAPIIQLRDQGRGYPAETALISRRNRGNKNLAGHFYSVAKEILPSELFERISHAAAAAKNDNPELGFMKHFARLTEAEVHPTQFQMLQVEATRRMLQTELVSQKFG